MIQANARVLAVIPARGGSKGVPRKNIRPLAGRPLIEWTIDQAREVPEITFSVVSTDDDEIAAVARAAGVRVIMRPAKLATSEAPTEWALIHALDELAKEGQEFDMVVILEPTSPLRRPQTISTCVNTLAQSDAPSLMTVVETRANIGRIEDGFFRTLIPNAPRRRQLRQPFYVESSTVYVCRVDHLRRTGWIVAENWLAVPVEDEEATDINEELDFVVAQSLMSKRKELS